MRIISVKTLPKEFDFLVKASVDEGQSFIKRTKDDWENGKNKFDKHGEVFFLAYQNDQVIGCGGVSIDPYTLDQSVGRIRHLYVHPSFRRKGIARHIIQKCIEAATENFKVLRLRANQKTVDSYKFYEAIGFSPVESEEFVTHCLELEHV
jgi:GNAT superfamily N-acetyltransferase